MGFQDLDIAIRYRSNEHEFPNDFLVPVLSKSILYKRAVGFFSTSSLIHLSIGLFRMAEMGGKVQLVCSPKLSDEDIKAINAGYKKREELVEQSLMVSLTEPLTAFEEERLNLVATMIASGMLEIKLAFMEADTGINLYHEKMSIFVDEAGNRISYAGSLNESDNAFNENFESVYTFCSWKDASQQKAVWQAEIDFDDIWADRTRKLRVIPFPEIVVEKLLKFRKNKVSYDTDYREYQILPGKSIFKIPDHVILRPYQEEAISNWFMHGCQGIMGMCTGAGKTFTAMAGSIRLGEKLDDALAAFIVCPYIHLVSQWEEDVVEWGFEPIIAHSKSTTIEWQERLRSACRRFHKDKKPFICITTNDTFSNQKIQPLLEKFDSAENVLLIVDEAHNFGTSNLAATLPENVKYRIALSATIERYMDKEGTERIFNYFGEQCINYGLEQAIKDGTLVPYDYHPIPVYLDADELKIFQGIANELKKYLIEEHGKFKISDAGMYLVYKRTRLLAGARAKVPLLMDLLKPMKAEKNILVYCGATSIEDEDSSVYEKQINIVTKKMREELGMSVQRFTAEESLIERQNIKEFFKEGLYQAVTAILCLDEGVNIPGISTAFIMASSRNPKQFIQRRGRLLRRSNGKEKAVIYDFVTLPRDLRDVRGEFDYDVDKNVLLGEMIRILEFGRLAQNPDEANLLVDKIMTSYNVYFNVDEEAKKVEGYYGDD